MICACKDTAERAATGRMQMRARVPHSRTRLCAALDSVNLPYEVDGEMVEARIESTEHTTLFYETLGSALSSVEREDIRALFLPHDKQPAVNDYFDVDTLEHHLGVLQTGWLRKILHNGELTSVLQPIVHAQRPELPFAYEALLRLRVDGTLRSAEDVFSIARRAGLLPALDRAARESAIVNGGPHLHGARLFINFTPSSIYDPVSCLQATVALLDRAGISHSQVVFEVIESERIDDIEHLRRILLYYRERGFAVALDDLGSGYATLSLLNDLRPDFVKIDMGLIQGVDKDPYKAIIAEKLIEAAHRIGVTVIAEGVENAGEFAWARDRGVALIQGFHVARPALPPVL